LPSWSKKTAGLLPVNTWKNILEYSDSERVTVCSTHTSYRFPIQELCDRECLILLGNVRWT
jgi:hypothetical protein